MKEITIVKRFYLFDELSEDVQEQVIRRECKKNDRFSNIKLKWRKQLESMDYFDVEFIVSGNEEYVNVALSAKIRMSDFLLRQNKNCESFAKGDKAFDVLLVSPKGFKLLDDSFYHWLNFNNNPLFTFKETTNNGGKTYIVCDPVKLRDGTKDVNGYNNLLEGVTLEKIRLEKKIEEDFNIESAESDFLDMVRKSLDKVYFAKNGDKVPDYEIKSYEKEAREYELLELATLKQYSAGKWL